MRLVYTFFILLIFANSIFANTIDLYSNGEYVHSYTIPQFKSLINNNEFVLEQINAEKEGRVVVELLDEEFSFNKDGLYQGYLRIKWLNENGSTLKQLKVFIELKATDIEKNNSNIVYKWYSDIANIGFPISIIILLLLLL